MNHIRKSNTCMHFNPTAHFRFRNDLKTILMPQVSPVYPYKDLVAIEARLTFVAIYGQYNWVEQWNYCWNGPAHKPLGDTALDSDVMFYFRWHVVSSGQSAGCISWIKMGDWSQDDDFANVARCQIFFSLNKRLFPELILQISILSWNQGFQMSESGIDLEFDLLSQDDFEIENDTESGNFYKLKSRALETLPLR